MTVAGETPANPPIAESQRLTAATDGSRVRAARKRRRILLPTEIDSFPRLYRPEIGFTWKFDRSCQVAFRPACWFGAPNVIVVSAPQD
jgi:hypothetical protein